MPRGDALAVVRDGWTNHQTLVVRALQDLTPYQLGLRAAPGQWAVWQLAGHTAGARAYWFHDWMGEGDPSVRDLFRVSSTTVPDLPLDDAGWEDDETNPRNAAELVEGLTKTWAVIDECLSRWTADDLRVDVTKHRPSGARTVTRGWVTWHVLEHDIHHAGEISQILGGHGLPPLGI
jgi:uncharacterized damage-inducible protein DinB